MSLSSGTHTLKVTQKPVVTPVFSKTFQSAVVGDLTQRAILVPTAARSQRTGIACSAVLPTHGAVQSKSIGDGDLPLCGAAGKKPTSCEAPVQPFCIELGIKARIAARHLLELVAAHSRWEGVVVVLCGCLERML